jgi:hypothetical protein
MASVSVVIFLLRVHAIVSAQIVGFDDHVGVASTAERSRYWWGKTSRCSIAIQDVAQRADVNAVSLERFDESFFQIRSAMLGQQLAQ